jgi:hypothetical protein
LRELVSWKRTLWSFARKLSCVDNLQISEPKNRIFWLAEAERWSRHAQDEISYQYEECNVIQLRDAASHPNVAV